MLFFEQIRDQQIDFLQFIDRLCSRAARFNKDHDNSQKGRLRETTLSYEENNDVQSLTTKKGLISQIPTGMGKISAFWANFFQTRDFYTEKIPFFGKSLLKETELGALQQIYWRA